MKRFTKFAITLLAVGLALFAVPYKKSSEPVTSEGRLLNYHAAKGLFEAAGFGEGVAEAQAVSSVFPQNFPACGPGGCYFSSPVLLPDGSAAAPSIGFSTQPGTGFFHGPATGGVVDVTNASVWSMRLQANGIWLRDAAATVFFGSTPDVQFMRDNAANTLAMRNGGTAGAPVPQTFNVYNFCDGANCATGYERGSSAWVGNIFTISTASAGTGVSRSISLEPNSGVVFTFNLIPAVTDTRTVGNATGQYQTAYLSRSVQGSYTKSLTDGAAATAFVRIAVPTNGSIGGRLIYTAKSDAGASGALTSQAAYTFAGADKTGTVTCGLSAQLELITAYSRANTLICTVTPATSTTNCDLLVTCADNLAAAQTITFNWRLDMPIPATITPQ